MALALLDLNGDEQQFRIFRDRENPMENLSREQFQYRYRVTKEIAADLCNLLQDELNRPTRRSQALPVSLVTSTGCTVPQCAKLCTKFLLLYATKDTCI